MATPTSSAGTPAESQSDGRRRTARSAGADGGTATRRRRKRAADPYAAGDDLFGSTLDKFSGDYGEAYPDDDNPYRAPSRSRETRRTSASATMSTAAVWFSFEGRLRRGTYWNALIAMNVLTFIVSFLATSVPEPARLVVSLIVGILILVFAIWVGLAVQIKRWHDRGKSGAMVLINLIPLIGGIWALVECGCLPGTPGPNEYGPEPE